MEERMRKFTLVAALVAVAAFVFVSTGVRAVFYAPEAEFKRDLPIPESTSLIGLPARLSIPALEIDTAIEHVGINAKGNMAAPRLYAEVAWYKYGARPGDKGSAVVAGHLDNGFGLDGVFKNLDGLQVGDDIFVTTEEGEELHFVVSSVATYPYEEVPVEELFARADKAHLNLITCKGEWIKDAKTYSERLVVYTVLV